MTVGGLATLLASGRNVILLPFLTRGLTIEDYGVWVKKKLYGREYMGIERATFLIDAKGVIRNL